MIKPILFNTEMIRAILAGKKTQTRRCVRFNECDVYDMACFEGKWNEALDPENPPEALIEWFVKTKARRPFAPGDILWVRETWTREPLCKKGFIYRAIFDQENSDAEKSDYLFRWYPSIHMPKEAARIFLKVKDIRAERLWDMDEDAAIAEGIPDSPAGTDSLLQRFSELWGRTLKREDLRQFGCHANPWVWVIEFERCDKPEGWCGK